MPLTDLAWPRRTARLLLRPAEVRDAEAVWAFVGRPEVARWTSLPGVTWREFRERYDDPDRRADRLVVELGGVVVGDLGVWVADGWSQVAVRGAAAATEASLGWSLDPAHHGRGLATEAVAELLEVCLAPPPGGLGLRRVTASCFAANEPSWRLMERVGMRREAHAVRDSLHAELGWLDGLTYALLADERRGGSPDGRSRQPDSRGRSSSAT